MGFILCPVKKPVATVTLFQTFEYIFAFIGHVIPQIPRGLGARAIYVLYPTTKVFLARRRLLFYHIRCLRYGATFEYSTLMFLQILPVVRPLLLKRQVAAIHVSSPRLRQTQHINITPSLSRLVQKRYHTSQVKMASVDTILRGKYPAKSHAKR
jgi:hypothetical protein